MLATHGVTPERIQAEIQRLCPTPPAVLQAPVPASTRYRRTLRTLRQGAISALPVGGPRGPIDRIRQQAAEQVVDRIPATVAWVDAEGIPATPRLTLVVEQARQASQASGRAQAGPADLALALLGPGAGLSGQILANLQVNVEALQQGIAQAGRP